MKDATENDFTIDMTTPNVVHSTFREVELVPGYVTYMAD